MISTLIINMKCIPLHKIKKSITSLDSSVMHGVFTFDYTTKQSKSILKDCFEACLNVQTKPLMIACTN